MNSMGDSREYMKGSSLRLGLKWLGGIGAIVVLAAVIFPIFQAPFIDGVKGQCLGHLKQLGTSVAMYQSDFDDRIPPYFTFDGTEQAKKFMYVTLSYTNNKEIYRCPLDQGQIIEGQEGLPGDISYVHCLSFKSKIRDFDKGNRVIHVTSSLPNIATTTYLRDPIRSASLSGQLTFTSPHGLGFTVVYLDTHIKFRKPIDINTEL